MTTTEREAFERYIETSGYKCDMTNCDPTFLKLLEDTCAALNVEVEAILAIGIPVINVGMGFSRVAFSKTYRCNVITWTVLLMGVASGKTQVTKFFQVRCLPFFYPLATVAQKGTSLLVV